MPLINLNASGSAVPLPACDGPCLLRNRDLVNSIIVGDDVAISGANPNRYSIIDPLGALSYEDAGDLYAQALTGTAVLDIIPGASGAVPSAAQIAAQIAASGVSFLAAPVSLYNISALTFNGGQAKVLVPVSPSPVAGYAPVNQLGYEIGISADGSSVGSSPFFKIDVAFYDDDSVSAVPIYQMTWWMPFADNTSGTTIRLNGNGPLRGSYMSITATNQQGNQARFVTCQVRGTGRAYVRDDWRTPLLATVPGWTNPGGNPAGNQLAEWSGISLGFGTSTTRILPLFSGKVWCRLSSNTASSQGQYEIIPINIGNQRDLVSVFNAENELYTNLPRDPCFIRFSNNAGSGSITMAGQIIISEY